MTARRPEQHRPGPARWRGLPLRAAGIGLACAAAVAACGRTGPPDVGVEELSWACGESRCSATFRLTAGEDSGAVLMLVRAYEGDSVASREIVGEHREQVVLRAGQPRRFTVSVDTRRPANRVRVIVERG